MSYAEKQGGKLSSEQALINDFLNDSKSKKSESGQPGFNQYIPDHDEKAYELSAKFMEIANENPDRPIEKIIEHAKKVTETENSRLVHNALLIFTTHHPAARMMKNLRISLSVQRSPVLFVSKEKKVQMAPGPVVSDEKVEDAEGDIELFMNWFREDPNLNKHYECWNILYGGSGIPDPMNPTYRIYKDRKGEMFIYMYRQMLARYDAERLGLNLPLTSPLDNYRAPIKEGYKPNKSLVTIFGSREANLLLHDDMIENMEHSRKSIEQDIKTGVFYDGSKIDINLLGAVVSGAYKKLSNHYGNLHAHGHITIASISDKPGVMSDPRVASHDPVFWRWHRHIDNLVNQWEENQEPNDFSNSPPVKLRDVLLAFKNELPISHGESEDKEATEFGENKFGGENFDMDVSSNEYVTNELQTRMKSRFWTYVGLTENIDYLFLREFYYFFRVENTSSSPFEATFRVFIVPEELAESRRHWIELDKFKGGTFPPNSKKVVCRSSDMSSVVRQPPRKTRNELDEIHGTIKEYSSCYADCGWPYHLLLPRGRRGGMKFKLLAFISYWSQDTVPTLSRYGSISFGGHDGLSDKYPDSKPMGYPLDRPFKNNSYEETFAGLNNAKIRDVSIRWVDEWQEVFDDD